MPSYSDLDNMWDTQEACIRSRKFYKKCIFHIIRIIIIYFICQYLFIPKR